MDRMCLILNLIIVLLFSVFPVSGFAREKVVVVPLGKTSTGTITAIPWIKVYDADDTFVGYLINADTGKTNPVDPTNVSGSFAVVSSQGYIANIYTIPGSYYPKINPAMIPIHYLDSECVGSLYILGEPYYVWGAFEGVRPGAVFLGGGQSYYIPLDAVPVKTSQYYTQLGCAPETLPPGNNTFYPWLSNESAVTGFQNSYTLPFKTVFELPPAP